MMQQQTQWFWACAAGLVSVAACASHARPSAHSLADGGLPSTADGSQASTAGQGAGSSGASGSGSGSAGAGNTDGGAGTAKTRSYCNGSCQCSDGIDNDGDGQIDGFDTECTGPNDNDEGTFATGIPGDNVDPKWQDCFYDGNSGAGDDGCRYSTDCLTGKKPASDPACTLAQKCIDFCKPLVPNGCDCFGCCEIRKPDGSTVNIVAAASCSLSQIDKCTTCVPSSTCGNTCGECELCPGKTVADLPAKCSSTPPSAGTGGSAGSSGTGGTAGSAGAGGTGSTPPPYQCDQGLSVCTSSGSCQAGYYCSFGCCLLTPPG